MSRKTVYEDKAEKEEARRRKRQEQMQKHIVKCPHCGKDVLDHMTECPNCHGKLDPRGYTPMSDEKRKKIRFVTYAIGFAIAIAVIVVIFVFK